MTSAIDSMFICSSGRLLPVSIVDTPSIMMLGSPPPPRRCGVWLPSLVTPGARNATAVKLRLKIGRFSTDSVEIVNDRSPLVDWISGASLLTWTVSLNPPTSRVTVPTLARSPGLTAISERLKVLKPSIVTCSV